MPRSISFPTTRSRTFHGSVLPRKSRSDSCTLSNSRTSRRHFAARRVTTSTRPAASFGSKPSANWPPYNPVVTGFALIFARAFGTLAAFNVAQEVFHHFHIASNRLDNPGRAAHLGRRRQ